MHSSWPTGGAITGGSAAGRGREELVGGSGVGGALRIVVEGNFSQVSSYGLVNLNIGRELARRGHEVSLVSLDIDPADVIGLLSGEGRDVKLAVGEPAKCPEVRIRQMWPPVWVRRCREERMVVIQPWEYGSIPLEWLDGVNRVDAIWVPSEYCKRSYLQAGVNHKKIWVVPNGADRDSVVSRAPSTREKLQLLFLGGTIFRKGIDVLIRALDDLDDDVLARLELLVKDVGADSFYANQSVLADALRDHPRVGARTRVERRHLGRRALLNLIAGADALVHPYRAEGFGLPVLEAMALGTLVVHTQGGATNEFCGQGESVLIPSTLSVADSPRVGESMLADQCYWLEPSVEDLSKQIGALVEGRIDTAALCKAAERRAQELSWERVGEIADAALVGLSNGSPGDELSRLSEDLSSFLAGANGRPAVLLSRLVAVGDIASAHSLAQLVERQERLVERVEIASVRERLGGLVTATPDVWSGATYRAQLAAAQFEKRGHFSYTHDFEGGDEATYAIAQRLSHYFSECSSVLDIACGQGSMMRVLRSQGKLVHGIDADPALVRKLRADGFSVHEGFVPGDLAALGTSTFDGVFLGHIVEHLLPAQFEAVLDWIYEHMEPRGVVLIQTPDFATASVGLENFWLDSTHLRPYPVRLLKAMLSKTGFIPIEGACGPVRDIASLDVIAVARSIPRLSQATSASAHELTPAPASHRAITVAHYALFHGNSGFSHASRDLLDRDGLIESGVEVVEVSLDSPSEGQPARSSVPFRFADGVEHNVAIVDVPAGWLSTVSSGVRARYRIARTTFEATPLPLSIQGAMRAFDEVWCFSNFDAGIFIDSGVDQSSIAVMPPGVAAPDPEIVRERRGSERRDVFNFLSVFNFESRKNPLALVRAFCEVAAKAPECTLTLKVSGITPPDFENWLRSSFTPGQTNVLQGRLRIITSALSREALTRLYLSSDAFVLPTRGEGYGLPFLEALAHGVATICPDVGGHREFCTESNSLMVTTTAHGATSVMGAGVFRESFWREVDGEHLVERMLEALMHPDELRERGERGLSDAAAFSVSAYRAASRRRLEQIVGSS